jgi:branched-subunit amino acid transport protein
MIIDKGTLWFVIIALGLGSFGLRFVFTGLVGDRQMPAWLLRHLRYTAVAILPALVAPQVLWPAATDGTFDMPRVAAAAVTLVVGITTKNVLGAIISGAVTLYALLWLLG